jgi:hypothetical protein
METITMNAFSFLFDCKEGTIESYEFIKEDEDFLYYDAIREGEKIIIKVYTDYYDFK